ncbi:MAG: glycosyltransferase, partial [Candidatus Dormibacteria bacterium]
MTRPEPRAAPLTGNGAPPAPSFPTLRTCVASPAYNESDTIAGAIAAPLHHMPCAHLVVVDDGSTDATGARAAAAGATVIPMALNLGIGGAVQTGYRYAL